MSRLNMMVKVVDEQGWSWLVNLDQIVAIQEPSPITRIQDNLNVELWILSVTIKPLRFPVGTYNAAVDELISEYNSGPQQYRPKNYIKRQTNYA